MAEDWDAVMASIDAADADGGVRVEAPADDGGDAAVDGVAVEVADEAQVAEAVEGEVAVETPAAAEPTLLTAKSFAELSAAVKAAGGDEARAVDSIRAINEALYSTPENLQAFLLNIAKTPAAKPAVEQLLSANEDAVVRRWLAKNANNEAGRQRVVEFLDGVREQQGVPIDPDDPNAAMLRKIIARQDELAAENKALKDQLSGVTGKIGRAETTGEFEAFLKKNPEARKVQPFLVEEIQEARKMGADFSEPGALAAFALKRFERQRRIAAAQGALRIVPTAPGGKRPSPGGVATVAKGADTMKDGKITKEALDAVMARLDASSDGGAATG